MSQTKKQLSKNKIGISDRASIAPGQLRSNYGSVKNRGGRASQLGRQQSVRHSLEDLVEPPSRSGKSRRGSIFQKVCRKKQQPMNQKPSSYIEEHEQVEEEYLQPPEEISGRTRNTPLPTRSPPPRDRGGQSLPITPSRLPLIDDDFLDSPRRYPRGLGINRVLTSRSNDFINSLRRSPRGLDNNRVQRSLEAEYNASNAGHMQRHRQVQHQSDQVYNTQVSSSSRQQPLGLQHQVVEVHLPNDNLKHHQMALLLETKTSCIIILHVMIHNKMILLKINTSSGSILHVQHLILPNQMKNMVLQK
ncbi:hypothetical protein C5167_026651 [Papaver somniferum]|nr:hypothetical protein C5167_026651 [Papaver somniferum]